MILTSDRNTYSILVAPHREPLDVFERLPIRQRHCEPLAAVPPQGLRAAALVAQAQRARGPGGLRCAHVEVGGWETKATVN